MSRQPFSRSALVVLFACGAALFALSILLHATDSGPVSTGASRGARFGANSSSTSAIGHAGLYDMLRRLDLPVRRGVGNTLALAGSNGTLIVAEPELSQVDQADGRRLMSARRLLLVLPKWRGRQDPGRPAWIAAMSPLPLQYARQTLALVDGGGDVLRIPWPEAWETNTIGIEPVGMREGDLVQLMRSGNMRPLVGTEEGMLLGEMREGRRRILVLSDPDVLANAGLVRGGNAGFMLGVLDDLRFWRNADARAPVVFDETLHGFAQAEGSVLKLAFRFPFSVVVGLICLTALLLLYAGSGRFGAPLRPSPNLDFGKAGLIDNSARLLDYAGHHGVLLKDYVRMTVRSAARVLHAPAGLEGTELARWLDRIGKARGVGLSCENICNHIANLKTGEAKDLARLFESAGDICRWKGEILHGFEQHRHPG